MFEGFEIFHHTYLLGQVFGVPVTTTTLMGWVTIATITILGRSIGTHTAKIPSMFQTAVESVFSWFLDYVQRTIQSYAFAPYTVTFVTAMFLYVLLGNWLLLVPGIGSIMLASDHRVLLMYPLSADTSLGIALVGIIAAVVFGIVLYRIGVYLPAPPVTTGYVGYALHVGKQVVLQVARLLTCVVIILTRLWSVKTLIVIALFVFPYLVPLPIPVFAVLAGGLHALAAATAALAAIAAALAPHNATSIGHYNKAQSNCAIW